MKCTLCARDLPAGFPGATVTCACGQHTTLPASEARSQKPVSNGPYRGGSTVSVEPTDFRCPFCSNMCPSLARVCPHCDVRLENVRCGRCWTLQEPGSFTCGRCGEALDLEPLLDATNAPCPRCNAPLEAAAGNGDLDDARTHECPRCGGVFIPRDVLAEILTRAEVGGPFLDPPRRPITALDEVRYMSCPQCHSSMNRMNFGRVSGVIVDVCKTHGTWFDGGELTRVIAFAASGGLYKTRAREAEEKKVQVKEREKLHSGVPFIQTRHDAKNHVEEWRSLLRDLFFW